MTREIPFALNHVTAPRLTCGELIDLAAGLGCAGIELRNDLVDKQLTSNVFFDGKSPEDIGAYARMRNIRVAGLSEIYGFNRWSPEMRSRTELLIGQAKRCGAKSISLIPTNDGDDRPLPLRQADLEHALSEILPMLVAANMIALIEPLGFQTSSLRHKREALDAITAVGGEDRYKLVHDTFHHFIAGEQEFFAAATGIVHISGVIKPSLDRTDMRDEHRVLVTTEDRLGNIAQIRALEQAGYQGCYSVEAFATSVQTSAHIEQELGASIKAIKAELAAL